DGTDPEAIAGAFGWAAERARAGRGPTLIETVAMRMCGHAHHDDMLYLGRDPQLGWDYPPPGDGYANRDLYGYWATRDPIAQHAAKLQAEGLVTAAEIDRFRKEAEALVDAEARAIIDAPWPEGPQAGVGVFANERPRMHVGVLDPAVRLGGGLAGAPSTAKGSAASGLSAVWRGSVEAAPAFDAKGRTFLEGVMLGVGDALRSDPRVFVYGEDVGGSYGNAFLLLKPLLKEYGDRILNSPLGESGVLGVCVGAAV